MTNRHIDGVETYSQIALVFGTGAHDHTYTLHVYRDTTCSHYRVPQEEYKDVARVLHAAPAAPGGAWACGSLSWSQFPTSSWSQLPRGVMCMCIGWSCERNRKELRVGIKSDPCNPLLDLVACTAVPSRLGLKARDHTFTARADRRVDQIGCDTSSRRHPTPLNCFASKLR